MNEYDIKRGHLSNIEGSKMDELMKEIFGNVKKDEEKRISTFGALEKIMVWMKDKKTLCVETIMDPKVDNDTASETIRLYNEFLFKLTGFTTKERKKRVGKR